MEEARSQRRDSIDVDTVVETNLQIIPQSCLRIAIVPEALHLKKILWCLALLVGIRLYVSGGIDQTRGVRRRVEKTIAYLRDCRSNQMLREETWL